METPRFIVSSADSSGKEGYWSLTERDFQPIHPITNNCRQLSIWSLLLLSGVSSNASSPAPLPPSPHPSIQIKRLSQERDRFPSILRADASQPLYENALVIHNDDKRDVVAMLAIWKITDATGQIHTIRLRSDIFMSVVPDSVLPSGQDLILSPLGWIHPRNYSQMEKAGISPDNPADVQRMADLLRQATSVSLSIDSVIFSDGEVCGVNSARFDQLITARKNAAVGITSQVRNYMARGQDWRPYIDGITGTAQPAESHTEAYWQHHFASTLSSSQGGDDKALLEYYEELPKPMAFHPCNKGN